MTTTNYLRLAKDMMLLSMPVRMKILKRYVRIQLFYVLGLNIFAQHSQMNGPRERMENLFLKNLMVVDELNVQPLIPCIQEYLIKNKYEFLQQNPIGILETAYQHEQFTELWNFCLEKICQEPEILFNSDKFIGLKAPIIELFLKRDDLCLDEIIIWDSLIKWSLAQNPTISQDVTKWNKEEFTIMERTLNRFIPLIRFYHITPENFLDKVYPFKELLPNDLFKSILAFHMTPNRKLNNDILPRFPKYSVD